MKPDIVNHPSLLQTWSAIIKGNLVVYTCICLYNVPKQFIFVFYRKLKIAIAIILTLLICGVTLYFLFPRTPSLRLVSVTQYNASFPDAGDVYILIKVLFSMYNMQFILCDFSHTCMFAGLY